MDARRALIIGAAGQDGTLLGQYLDGLGYQLERVGRGDAARAPDVVSQWRPHEVYYLAAYHHSAEARPPEGAELLAASMAVNFTAFVDVLDAIARTSRDSRVFYASSSLVFGDDPPTPQDENTPVRPSSAYAISKSAGMAACRLYRKEHGVFAAAGVLFNHESPLRGAQFVTRKIVRAAVAAARGATAPLRLGSLDAVVDWSAARDVVRAMHHMLSLERAQDLVIASGVARTVREFAAAAFAAVGLDYRQHVEVDETVLRRPPATRIGDPAQLLASGFVPQITFNQLVGEMVAAEQGIV